MKLIFPGMQPTAGRRVGNCYGALRSWTRLSGDPENESIVCVVDVHAVRLVPDGAQKTSTHVCDAMDLTLASQKARGQTSSRRDTLSWTSSVLVACLLGLPLGCEEEASDGEPDRVVAEFVTRMQRVHGDRKAARAAYELLWSDARRNLAERAKRASDVAGREIAPEEMLPPSRFSLNHKPQRYDARIDGDWAEVSVTAENAGVDRVKCVREDGKWRVVLELPPLPPIERRLDGGL